MRGDLVEDAGGGEDAGQTGAGMDARADQEEIAHVLAGIVRAEPCALGQSRFEPELRAAEGIEPALKVERRYDLRRDPRPSVRAGSRPPERVAIRRR